MPTAPATAAVQLGQSAKPANRTFLQILVQNLHYNVVIPIQNGILFAKASAAQRFHMQHTFRWLATKTFAALFVNFEQTFGAQFGEIVA